MSTADHLLIKIWEIFLKKLMSGHCASFVQFCVWHCAEQGLHSLGRWIENETVRICQISLCRVCSIDHCSVNRTEISLSGFKGLGQGQTPPVGREQEKPCLRLLTDQNRSLSLICLCSFLCLFLSLPQWQHHHISAAVLTDDWTVTLCLADGCEQCLRTPLGVLQLQTWMVRPLWFVCV